MVKEYTIYFEPVVIYAENEDEAEKFAIEDIKEYPVIKQIIETE